MLPTWNRKKNYISKVPRCKNCGRWIKEGTKITTVEIEIKRNDHGNVVYPRQIDIIEEEITNRETTYLCNNCN